MDILVDILGEYFGGYFGGYFGWILLKGPSGGGHFDGKTKMVYHQRSLSATCSIADIN